MIPAVKLKRLSKFKQNGIALQILYKSLCRWQGLTITWRKLIKFPNFAFSSKAHIN